MGVDKEKMKKIIKSSTQVLEKAPRGSNDTKSNSRLCKQFTPLFEVLGC